MHLFPQVSLKDVKRRFKKSSSRHTTEEGTNMKTVFSYDIQDHKDSLKLYKCSLNFKNPNYEIQFHKLWKKESKRNAHYILMGIPLLELLICLVTPKSCLITTFSVMLTLASLVNYGLYKVLGFISGSTIFFILVTMWVSSIRAIEATETTNLYVVLKAVVYLLNVSFLGPTFGGFVLSMDFRLLVFLQVWIVLCHVHVLKALSRVCPDPAFDQNEFGQVVSVIVIVCILILALIYVMKRSNRMSFLWSIRMRKQTKRRLEEKLKHQREIWKAKGRYIAQVAHDIGSPLAAFTLAIDVLRDLATTAEMKDTIETAQCAIDLMTVTRKEALDNGKSMEGLELQPTVQEVCLEDIIKRCSRLMKHLQSGGVQNQEHAEFYLSPTLPNKIFTDGDWIWTMMINYLSNAKKYSNGGRITTTVYDVPEDQMLRVEVADDGIGVPEKHKRHLFKPFGQLMKCAGGTGLGLHGIYLKAKALEGQVGLRKNPTSESGSIFWFQIPCRAASDDKLIKGDEFYREKQNILFIGEWPLEAQTMATNQLKESFNQIDTLRFLSEFQKYEEYKLTRYSVIFWMIENDTVEKSHEELTNVLTEMKDTWAKPWVGKRAPVIYISCEWFQMEKQKYPEGSENSEEDIGRRSSASDLEASPRKTKRRCRSVIFSRPVVASSESSVGTTPGKERQILLNGPRFRTTGGEVGNTMALFEEKKPEEPDLQQGYKDQTPKLPDLRQRSEGASRRSSFSIRISHRPDGESMPNAKLSMENILLSKFDKALNEVGFGILLKHPLYKCDFHSLALQIKEFQVNEGSLPTVIKSTEVVPVGMDELADRLPWQPKPAEDYNSEIEDILVVDDDPIIIKLFLKMIQKDMATNNFKVTPKVNGFEGLNALKEKEYAAAVIDLNMPVMDGLECIRRFREWETDQLQTGFRKLQQPIIMLSANAHKSHQKEAISTGANEFVAKPVQISELIKVINGVKHHKKRRRYQELSPTHALFAPEEPDALSSFGSISQYGNAIECQRGQNSSKRILVVEDDHTLRKMYKRMLENKGYQVTTESNGETGLAQLIAASASACSFYAVIVDHEMPVMNGIECIERFREWQRCKYTQEKQLTNKSQHGNPKVFLVSGSTFKNNSKTNQILPKFDKIFTKPVNIKEILGAIESTNEIATY